jgi:hypothetical protein
MTKTNRLLEIFNTLLATILVLVLVQFAPSVANANSTTIVACADKKTGALRIAYKKCTKKENNVTWGVTGPQGTTGATGPQGSSGAPGATGPAGANGQQGSSGPQGATGPQGAAGVNSSGNAIVKNANGVRLQNVVDLNWKDGGPIVLKDDLLWGFYKTTGEPYAIRNASMRYLDSECEEGFVYSNGPGMDLSLTAQDTFAFYDHLSMLQPEFYKIKYEILHDDLGLIYEKYQNGSCGLNGMGVSHYYYLEALTPPTSLPAPLTLEFQ